MDVNALVMLSKIPLIKQSSHTDRWPCKEGSERWTCASIQQDRMDGVISGEEPTSHSHKCLRDLFIGRAIELDSPSVELQDNLHDHTPHLIKPTCTKPRDPIQTARSTPHVIGVAHMPTISVLRVPRSKANIFYTDPHIPYMHAEC